MLAGAGCIAVSVGGYNDRRNMMLWLTSTFDLQWCCRRICCACAVGVADNNYYVILRFAVYSCHVSGYSWIHVYNIYYWQTLSLTWDGWNDCHHWGLRTPLSVNDSYHSPTKTKGKVQEKPVAVHQCQCQWLACKHWLSPSLKLRITVYAVSPNSKLNACTVCHVVCYHISTLLQSLTLTDNRIQYESLDFSD